MTQSDFYIAKSDFDEKQTILETNGRLTDLETFAGFQSTIRNPQDIPSPDYVVRERAEVIYWPREARTFYWKLSGPGYKKYWLSLAPDYFSLPARPADAPAGDAQPAAPGEQAPDTTVSNAVPATAADTGSNPEL